MSHQAVLVRSCALDPAALSARFARQFIRDVLTDSHHEEWVESAEVAISEVVTNAYLHAHTPLEISARVECDHVRVEVRDHNPTLPSARTYEAEATTGRGMNVVAAVTSDHGVDPLPDGKIVWFCVSDEIIDVDEDALLAQWGDDPDLLIERPTSSGEVTVELPGMPPLLWLAAREHHDALLRELALFRAEHRDDPANQADLALADEARVLISSTVARVVALAAQREDSSTSTGDATAAPATLDLLVDVRPDQAAAFAHLQDALDEGERLAVADRLLVHPGLPEIIALRDWACEQVVAQLRGAPPVRWAGADADRFTREVHDRTTDDDGAWDERVVREANRGAVAADDANRIVAVSQPFCDALGWDAADLIGRRVVTLVPHRFREAHVAGFSRHLSTGEVAVIGKDLELPVLRGDGTEVLCSFRIDHERGGGGHSFYIAWISPVG